MLPCGFRHRSSWTKHVCYPPDFMNWPSIGYPYRYQDFETNLKPSLNLSVSTSYLRPFFKYFLRASSTPTTEGGLKISSQDDLELFGRLKAQPKKISDANTILGPDVHHNQFSACSVFWQILAWTVQYRIQH